MDTSEQYIKMCEKAEEIQKGHEFDEGDYHGLLQNGLWSAHNYCTEDGFVGISPQKITWLPRQDQLQEVLPLEARSYIYALHEFASTVHDTTELRNFFRFTSMEQLWLAFVMKEKYGKTWDGDSWISI